MASTPAFALDKWYMDCISDSGDLVICYAASLRWRALVLHYSSTLECSGGAVHARTSLLQNTAPHIDKERVQWQCRSLGVHGEWQATDPPVQRTLLHTRAGSIEWHCMQPRSQASVNLGDKGIVQGIGYVEHIRLSLPPWHLPIRELRWGRYTSDKHGIVWIDWRGSHPLRLVFHNGLEVGGAAVEDDHVQSGDITVHFADSTVLRKGPLVGTALAAVPGIRNLFPARSLNTEECKWRSRGVLRGTTADTGWAIHEVVRFV